jgi:hypothetical protein
MIPVISNKFSGHVVMNPAAGKSPITISVEIIKGTNIDMASFIID